MTEPKDNTIRVRIGSGLRGRAKETAKKLQISEAAFVRMAIAKLIEKENPQQP